MKCHKGTCIERVVRKASTPDARPVVVDLSRQELDILEEIRFSNRPLRPKEIGDALDIPYQLVTRRVQQLQRHGLVVYAARSPISISDEGLRAIPDEDMRLVTPGSRR
jgi:predicted transcriptional regulator